MARILVIDDAFLRQIFADALTGAGHAVRLAADGREGFALLAKERPDLVVADMVLPGMGGPELVREVRRRDASVPIVAVSGLPLERSWSAGGAEDPQPASRSPPSPSTGLGSSPRSAPSRTRAPAEPGAAAQGTLTTSTGPRSRHRELSGSTGPTTTSTPSSRSKRSRAAAAWPAVTPWIAPG